MKEPTPYLLRVAGYGAQAAIVALVLSGIALALFFGGAGDFWGPVNDVLVVLAIVLMLPAVFAVGGLPRGGVGTWFAAMTWLVLAGLVLAAVGQLLLVVRVIDLQTSFVTGGVGILPALVWIAALTVLVLRNGVPAAIGRATGWWGAAFMAVTAVTVVGGPFMPGWLLYSMGLPLLVALAGWMWFLGRDLRAAAGPGA